MSAGQRDVEPACLRRSGLVESLTARLAVYEPATLTSDYTVSGPLTVYGRQGRTAGAFR